jgi:hypothetical protein
MMVNNPLFTASMHLVEQWLGLLTDLGRADRHDKSLPWGADALSTVLRSKVTASTLGPF